MTIKCRGQSLGGLHTGIQTEHIVKASKMVHLLTFLYILLANILNLGCIQSALLPTISHFR